MGGSLICLSKLCPDEQTDWPHKYYCTKEKKVKSALACLLKSFVSFVMVIMVSRSIDNDLNDDP